MRKTQKAGYSGELRDPILLPLPLAVGPPRAKAAQWRREKERWACQAQLQKLVLLMNHFGISPRSKDVWFQLTLALAKLHVPGMQVVSSTPKKGRPRKGPSNLELAIAVDTLRAERQLKSGRAASVREAIKFLRRRKPEVWGGYSEETLRNRYHGFWKGVPAGATFNEKARALFLGTLSQEM